MIDIIEDDDKKKKPPVDPLEKEMRETYRKKMAYDNRDAIDVARTAAQKSGVDPSLLYSSAYQEGLGKAIVRPDEVSEAYLNASHNGLDINQYPVDGFYNYGLDTFGGNYERLKKYLPADFDKRFKTYKAKNEKNEDIVTAAFMNNEDALTAKGAMIHDLSDQVDYYAKKYNIKIRPEDKDYFTLAAYNGGWGNAKKMLDEYAKSKNASKFIESGETTRQGVHKNITPRLSKKKLAAELLAQYEAELNNQQNVQQ